MWGGLLWAIVIFYVGDGGFYLGDGGFYVGEGVFMWMVVVYCGGSLLWLVMVYCVMIQLLKIITCLSFKNSSNLHKSHIAYYRFQTLLVPFQNLTTYDNKYSNTIRLLTGEWIPSWSQSLSHIRYIHRGLSHADSVSSTG